MLCDGEIHADDGLQRPGLFPEKMHRIPPPVMSLQSPKSMGSLGSSRRGRASSGHTGTAGQRNVFAQEILGMGSHLQVPPFALDAAISLCLSRSRSGNA